MDIKKMKPIHNQFSLIERSG